jgi:hypothetical protein
MHPTKGVPNSGERKPETLLVHKTPVSGGSINLSTLSIGDVIEGPGNMRWAIQKITDNGAYYVFTIDPPQQGFPEGNFTFSFLEEQSTPLTIIEDANYWAAEDQVQGRYQLNGGNWVTTQSQYSVDLKVQPLSASPDWDFMALTQ